AVLVHALRDRGACTRLCPHEATRRGGHRGSRVRVQPVSDGPRVPRANALDVRCSPGPVRRSWLYLQRALLMARRVRRGVVDSGALERLLVAVLSGVARVLARMVRS